MQRVICTNFCGIIDIWPYATLQVGVYFTEVEYAGRTRFVPRSVQVDLEAGVCNKVRSTEVNCCGL